MTPPIRGMDPNTYAMQYAQQNGISFDEAKQQLRAKYGDPQPPQGNFMVAGLAELSQSSGTVSATNYVNTDAVEFSSSSSFSGTSGPAKTYTTWNEIESAAWNIHESGENFGMTGKDARDIKKQTIKFKDEIDRYARSYEKEHKKSEYKDIKGRKNRETQWKNDAYEYAYKKFQENHPDIDIATVYYNDIQSASYLLQSRANLKPYN